MLPEWWLRHSGPNRLDVVASPHTALILCDSWLGAETAPTRALALAGIAQALIVIGSVFAGFGFIYRIVGLRTDYRSQLGQVDILRFDSPPASAFDRNGDQAAIDG